MQQQALTVGCTECFSVSAALLLASSNRRSFCFPSSRSKCSKEVSSSARFARSLSCSLRSWTVFAEADKSIPIAFSISDICAKSAGPDAATNETPSSRQNVFAFKKSCWTEEKNVFCRSFFCGSRRFCGCRGFFLFAAKIFRLFFLRFLTPTLWAGESVQKG